MSAAPPARAFRRDYDMALTREDFLRLLPVAVGGAPFRVQGGQVDSLGGDPAWRIRLEPRAGRPFGPVRIPVLAVALTIEGATDAQAAAFVDRFLLGYQRAGG
jgi:hypothetical protein